MASRRALAGKSFIDVLPNVDVPGPDLSKPVLRRLPVGLVL